jgi:hypothetical protein
MSVIWFQEAMPFTRMPPKSAQPWDRSSGIHPSFFDWPPPKILESWEAVQAGERIIQLACVVPDTDVCLLYNMLESCQLPQNWLRETYPAVWKQCMDYAAEMEAASKERDRLSAEFLKRKHAAEHDGHPHTAKEDGHGGHTASPPAASSSTGSTSLQPLAGAKRRRQ